MSVSRPEKCQYFLTNKLFPKSYYLGLDQSPDPLAVSSGCVLSSLPKESNLYTNSKHISLAEGNLGHFYFLTIVNRAAVNVAEQGSVE